MEITKIDELKEFVTDAVDIYYRDHDGRIDAYDLVESILIQFVKSRKDATDF